MMSKSLISPWATNSSKTCKSPDMRFSMRVWMVRQLSLMLVSVILNLVSLHAPDQLNEVLGVDQVLPPVHDDQMRLDSPACLGAFQLRKQVQSVFEGLFLAESFALEHGPVVPPSPDFFVLVGIALFHRKEEVGFALVKRLELPFLLKNLLLFGGSPFEVDLDDVAADHVEQLVHATGDLDAAVLDDGDLVAKHLDL